ILLATNGTSGPPRRLCDLRRYLRPNTLGAVFRSIVDRQSIRKTFRIRGQRYLQVKRSAVASPASRQLVGRGVLEAAREQARRPWVPPRLSSWGAARAG